VLRPQLTWTPGAPLTFGRFRGCALDRLRPELQAALESELGPRFDGPRGAWTIR
jgi:hypothetical protein